MPPSASSSRPHFEPVQVRSGDLNFLLYDLTPCTASPDDAEVAQALFTFEAEVRTGHLAVDGA